MKIKNFRTKAFRSLVEHIRNCRGHFDCKLKYNFNLECEIKTLILCDERYKDIVAYYYVETSEEIEIDRPESYYDDFRETMEGVVSKERIEQMIDRRRYRTEVSSILYTITYKEVKNMIRKVKLSKINGEGHLIKDMVRIKSRNTIPNITLEVNDKVNIDYGRGEPKTGTIIKKTKTTLQVDCYTDKRNQIFRLRNCGRYFNRRNDRIIQKI